MSNGIRVLVACEESQRVCIAFRKRGFKAFSCDILPCSGGHPEWHIQGDVLDHLNDGWDLMIAHPPCTYLSHAGARWLYPKKGEGINKERYHKGLKAKDFFLSLLNADIRHIAVENPFPSPVFKMPSETQRIQPFDFGHPIQKKTLLWLKDLPKLYATQNVEPEWYIDPKGIRHTLMNGWSSRRKAKTFKGIAEAMADQWGRYVLSQRQKDAKASGVETLRTPPTSEEVGIRAGDFL